jgi:hypothetical protein
MNSPMRSRFFPFSLHSSHMAWMSSLRSSYGGSILRKGISTDESRAPSMIGALEPTRIVTPRSLPGASALGIALMQCMQRTQLLSSMARFFPSQPMHLEGHFPTMSLAMSRLAPLA